MRDEERRGVEQAAAGAGGPGRVSLREALILLAIMAGTVAIVSVLVWA